MLKKLLTIVKQKHEIDKKQEWYQGYSSYFQGLKDEVEEVQTEIKENNTIHLEDELGDILRDYFNLLETLADEGKITSLENVLSRAEQKYTERIETILDAKLKDWTWNRIKKLQKKRLAQEHKEKYW